MKIMSHGPAFAFLPALHEAVARQISVHRFAGRFHTRDGQPHRVPMATVGISTVRPVGGMSDNSQSITVV